MSRIKRDAIARAKEGRSTSAPTTTTLSASLQNPVEKGSKAVDKIADPPPVGYYVIVGRGMAATVNLSTLLRTKWGIERLKHEGAPLPILFVGFEDPWAHYDRHQMGQFPSLLGLPSYRERPEKGYVSFAAPMVSRTFADYSKSEYLTMWEHCKFQDVAACVVALQPYDTGEKGKALEKKYLDVLKNQEDFTEEMLGALDARYRREYPKYRLMVVFPDGQVGLIYAHKVDLCTGIGRPRSPGADVVGAKFAKEAKGKLWTAPELWDYDTKRRKVITGVDGLFEETSWYGFKRICVMGSGGIAVNMIERARDDAFPPVVDWLVTKTLHASFTNPRNDPLLKHEKERRPLRIHELANRKDTATVLTPASDLWRFGRGSKVTLVREEENGRLTVEFAPSGEKDAPPSAVRDAWGTECNLHGGMFSYYGEARKTLLGGEEPWTYDRVIFASGLMPSAPGQPDHVLAAVWMNSILASGHGLVGLESQDSAVRVLGRAGTINVNWVKTRAGYQRLLDWEATVPVPAIPDGFTLNALKIALANHYFDDTPHSNVNTATRGRLLDLTDSSRVADAIVALRRYRPQGIESFEALARQIAFLKTIAKSKVVAELIDAVKGEDKPKLAELDVTLTSLLNAPKQHEADAREVVALVVTFEDAAALRVLLDSCAGLTDVPDLSKLELGYRPAEPYLKLE